MQSEQLIEFNFSFVFITHVFNRRKSILLVKVNFLSIRILSIYYDLIIL